MDIVFTSTIRESVSITSTLFLVGRIATSLDGQRPIFRPEGNIPRIQSLTNDVSSALPPDDCPLLQSSGELVMLQCDKQRQDTLYRNDLMILGMKHRAI